MHSVIRRLRTIVAMMYRADRRRFAIYFTTSLIDPVMPLVAGLLVKLIVNAVLAGNEPRAAAAAVMLGVIAPLPFLIKRIRSREAFVLIDKSTALYDQELMRLSSSLPRLSDVENPAYLDRVEQLRQRPAALGENGTMTSVLLWGTLQATLLVALLVSVHPMLLILPVAALPGVWTARFTQQRWQRSNEAAAPLRRRANQFFELATSPQRADEMRTLRAEQDLLRHHRALLQTADRALTATQRSNALWSLAARLVFVVGYVGAVALVVDRGIRGRATAGDVVLTVVLASIVSQQMITLIDAVSRLSNALTMIERFLWIVDYADHANEPTRGTAAVPATLTRGIALDNVAFAYPNGEADVLRDITLDLPAGAVIAIVGENGAGKSTLVNLLTGMYRPSRGAITIDGVDLKAIGLDAWRTRCTAAFQDFARIEATLQHAVGVGDLEHLDDEARVDTALERAGTAKWSDTLPDGRHTALGASFEVGVNLSGGQWQRVALSRAMMRDRPLLVVLDEPAANLDPIAETELFERHARAARTTSASHGTITLLVSHRLSTVRLADKIVVLRDGSICEQGSHRELLDAHGVYAELYQMQAANYAE